MIFRHNLTVKSQLISGLKFLFSLFLVFTLFFDSTGQQLIDVSEMNPRAKGFPLYRLASYQDSSLYLGGNIGYINDEFVPPIVKLTPDGQIDSSFHFEEGYSLDFFNDMAHGSAIIGDEVFILSGREVKKIRGNGSYDENFSLPAEVRVTHLSSHLDSLLISGTSGIWLASTDGNYRKINANLGAGYYPIRLIEINSEYFLSVITKDHSDYKLILFQDGKQVETFRPIDFNLQNIKNVELLSNGEFFFSGPRLQIGENESNGCYILTQEGEISPNSFHDVDLSFVDVTGQGLIYAGSDGHGGFFVAGRNSKSNYYGVGLARVFSTGVRDDSFAIKTMERENNHTLPQIIKRDSSRYYLLFNQFSYEGHSSQGLSLIDINGNIDTTFQVTPSGIPYFRSFKPYGSNEYLLGGSFIKSKNNTNPYLTGYSTVDDSSPIDFPVDLEVNDNFGDVKGMNNGDLMVGGSDRSGGGGALKIYREDSLYENITSLNSTSIQTVYNIHESAKNIYISGKFRNGTIYDVVKLNKDYQIDASYAPDEISESEQVLNSKLTRDEKLIIQRTDDNTGLSKMIRLDFTGKKDETFNDINLPVEYFRTPWQFVGDSIILVYDSNPNESIAVDSYDLDGNLLVENIFTLDRDANITDAQPLTDSTFIICGSFESLDGISRPNIALVSYEGHIYDDLIFNSKGGISHIEMKGDTLFMLGSGNINKTSSGGFYAARLITDTVSNVSIDGTEEGGIQISWDQDIRFRSFDLYRHDGKEEILLASLPKGSKFFIDESVVSNELYSYRIVSKNIFGENSTGYYSYEISAPLPPSNVQANYESGDIVLQWTDNSDNETGFMVYERTNEGPFLSKGEVSADVTAYTVEDVAIDAAYSYYVIAKGSIIDSDPSDITHITIFTPPAPSDLEGKYADHKIRLQWTDPSDDETGFRLYRSVDGEGFELLAELQADSISFIDESVSINSTYTYYVTTSGEYLDSEFSNKVLVDLVVPSAPQDLSVTYNEGSLHLSWADHANNELNFELFEKANDDDFSLLAEVPSNSEEYLIEDITVNFSYTYYLVAKGQIFSSLPSNEAHISIFKPSSPSNTVATYEDGGIVLQWDDNSDNETSFTIYESINDGSFNSKGEVSADVTAYTVEDVVIDASYSYYVIAKGSIIDSDPSDTTHISIYTPPAPSDLEGKYADHKIRLQWTDPSDDETGFRLYRSVDGEGFELLAELQADSISFIDESVSINSIYTYYVTTSGDFLDSEPSEELELNLSIPSSPTALEASLNAVNESILLEWQKGDGWVKNFIIEFGIQKEDFQPLDTISDNETEYTFLPQSLGDIFYFRVSAQNDIGTSDPSNVASVKTLVLNLSELSDDLLIYPNPSSGVLVIKVPSGEKVNEVKVIDESGRDRGVIKAHPQPGLFDFTSLGRGTYFIQFGLDGKIKSEKVVIK